MACFYSAPLAWNPTGVDKVPSTQIVVPSTQVNVPSLVNGPNLQPALCGR
jgi:hypothetical protein